MRTLTAVLALALAAVLLGKTAVAQSFKDSICPEATQYVMAVGRARTDDPPQRVYDVAQAAANAYEHCSKIKLSNGYREAQHYADTRGASFAVVAARALIALRRFDDARRQLEHWRALAQQVVDWQTEPTAFTSADVNGHEVTTDTDHRPSMYRASAKEIVAAADAALEEVSRLSRDISRPQTQQSPPPHP
ncbi:MAG: hypothetical protein JWM87_423 [Candidatus Eremiobacteraeota bacterium]|nr:hypothetical protein [Candidatus Eremiobacteraeota bacterium]